MEICCVTIRGERLNIWPLMLLAVGVLLFAFIDMASPSIPLVSSSLHPTSVEGGFGGATAVAAEQPEQAQEESPAWFTPEWFYQIFVGVIRVILGGITGALTMVLEWMRSWGFLMRTAPSLSYGHPAVKGFHQAFLTIFNALVALLLLLEGYNYARGRSQHVREVAWNLVMIFVAAHFSMLVIQQAIDLHNAFCDGFVAFVHSFNGSSPIDPWGSIDTGTARLASIVAYIFQLICFLAVALQMLVRLALLNLLIVLSPLGILALAVPQTQQWGQTWVQLFVSTLIVQFFQVVCLGLGGALSGSVVDFGGDVQLVATFVGIATAYLTLQIPNMLGYSLSKGLGRVPGFNPLNHLPGRSAVSRFRAA